VIPNKRPEIKILNNVALSISEIIVYVNLNKYEKFVYNIYIYIYYVIINESITT
jgi:hypothetical protein